MTFNVFFHSSRLHVSCCKIKTNKSFFKILDPGERCDLPLSNAPRIIANGALSTKNPGSTCGPSKNLIRAGLCEYDYWISTEPQNPSQVFSKLKNPNTVDLEAGTFLIDWEYLRL